MKNKKVYIETYGCQMNEYDTELVKSILKNQEYELTDTPEQADLVLFNTCSVRENANRKVLNRVQKIRHDHSNKKIKVGILGCMATNFRTELIENKKLKIDFIAGPDSYKKLPTIIEKADLGESAFDVTLSEFETYEDVYPTRESGINAWIAIMRGCDNFCTFCVVPYTRGRERSRSIQNIVDETRRLVDDGFKQVTLLGQNVNSYRHNGQDFCDLLQAVSEVPGVERIRFTSPHPKDFPRELLHLIAEKKNICNQIHLPLQAGNDRVLEMMNRTYTQDEFYNLVTDMRQVIPDLVLTTDVIVGFPTETDREFEDTWNVMKDVEFDSAFIFKYSERKNTVASRKFPDDVPEEIKTQRIVRLNELQKKISLKKNRAHIGQIHEIILEQKGTKKSDLEWQGRNDGNKLVIVPGQSDFKIGQKWEVEITDASAHVLKGKTV